MHPDFPGTGVGAFWQIMNKKADKIKSYLK